MRSRQLLALALTVAAILASPALLSANGLERSRQASRNGRLGMESIYEGDRQKNYLIREFATPQERIVITFHIKPDGDFRIESGKKQDILHLRQSGRRKPIVQVRMFRTADGFRLQFRALNGNRPRTYPTRLFVPFDTWTQVRLEWIAADGSLRVEKNNNLLGQPLTELDSSGHQVDLLRFGQVSKASRGWFGRIYFDNFEARKTP